MMSKSTSHWDNEPDSIYDKVGFIYLITNKVSGRKYIGVKRFWFSHRCPKTKTHPKRKAYYESDWKTYCGSSKTLSADIAKLGEDKFEFEILRYCYSKFQLHYYELKEQVDRGVMLSPDYYNALIRVYISKPKYTPKPFTMIPFKGKYYIKQVDKK